MAQDQSQEEDSQYAYNMLLAKALVQVMPATIRHYMRMWFDALDELKESPEQQQARNEYMWFILLMLQTNKIHEYFKNLPPTQLQPLRNVIPQSTIDEVLLASDQNVSWLDTSTEEEMLEKLNKRKVAPEEFLFSQPIPQDGIVCYFAAFSDQGP